MYLENDNIFDQSKVITSFFFLWIINNNKKKIMQKDLKIMDKELANNQLIRIHDQNTKQDQSLFRALSAAIYYSHLYAAQIKLDLRLGLVCNLNERKNNPYPPLGEGNILKKFINEGELVMNFWERQELECFHHVRVVIDRII